MVHPPYPWWHYAIDVGWGTSFAVAAMCGWTRLPRYRIGAIMLAVLAGSRLLMGSGGGLLLISLEPLLVIAVIISALHAAFTRVRVATEAGHVPGLPGA
jgi:hypothetical protein